VGGRSAQRRQTGGEATGIGGDIGEQQDAGGVLEEVAAGDSVPEAARLW
jgi:hypothetical protein